MAPADDTKRLVNRIFWSVLLIGGFYVSYLIMSHVAGHPAFSSPGPANYTRNICEDAYQSELHYEKVSPPYIDVTLKAGCFSGFIGLPDNWVQWQEQFLGNDPTDWVAEWYAEQSNPFGPYTHEQVKVSFPNHNVGPKKLRLEGKGTLRIYRVVGYPIPQK